MRLCNFSKRKKQKKLPPEVKNKLCVQGAIFKEEGLARPSRASRSPWEVSKSRQRSPEGPALSPRGPEIAR